MRYAIGLEYDGSEFLGWQIQRQEPTVQGTLERAISKVADQPIRVTACGRTDAGVHALGQVAHFDSTSERSERSWLLGVNSHLPQGASLLWIRPVDDQFHARFSATERVYWYLIWNTPVRSPFYQRYAWHIIQPLDVAAMKDAALCLVGTHDFTSFQGSDKEEVNPVREVKSTRLRKTRRNVILFEIHANSFLKHMVRNIIGTLADVDRGKLTKEEFQKILAGRDRCLAGITAPAQGLFLKQVLY